MFFGLRIFCVMLRGSALGEEVCRELLKAACNLYLAREKQKQENSTEGRKKYRKKIKNQTVEGVVVTRGQYAVLGSLCGMFFHADVEWAGGKSNVDFIVRTQDLTQGSLDDLMQRCLYQTGAQMAAAPWN